MNREPVTIIGTISGLVAAILALLVAFGIPITEDQKLAIMGVMAAFAPLIAAVASRNWVTPNGSVVEYERDGQVYAGEGSELETDLPIREAGSLDQIVEVTVPHSHADEERLYRLGHDGIEDTPRRSAE